jgi:outer membrane protein assembly factor BamB
MKHVAILGVALVLLSACAERATVLPGTREPLRADITPVLSEEARIEAEAITLPAAIRIAAWPVRAGSATGVMPHAALSATPAQIWSVNIGQGNGRRSILSTDPVAAEGRIFTMDAEGAVTAVSEAGAVLWRADLTPAFERDGDASGGGLGLHDGVLYATTGFGNFHALDPETGAERWAQRLDAPLSSPTFGSGQAYVVSRDSRAWSIDLSDGRIRWELSGAPVVATLVGSPAPALTERLVIFPLGSGELVAALRQSGIRVWGSTVAGNRRGVAYGNLSDIASDPVVMDRTLYAGTPAGRLVSMDAFSGIRNWTATDGAQSPALPVAGSVYFVSDRNELIRLDAQTGARIWARELPLFDANRLSRRKTVFAHFGPILAGERVWLASSDGVLRGFDPATGTETYSANIPGGAASRPIVMNDTLYVVGARGTLHAYR